VKPHVAIAVVLVTAVAFLAWRTHLWTIARPGAAPGPLALAVGARGLPVPLDATIPAVPFGSERLAAGHGVLLIHYWAPWERGSRAQAAALDSLRRLPEVDGLHAVVVCFDPFPSVARYVARQRLRLSVLIDGGGELRHVLPCPSVPYTYVLDGAGRVAIAQAGDVDWLSPQTRAVLGALLAEPVRTRPPGRTAL